jgi:hypothetical protein
MSAAAAAGAVTGTGEPGMLGIPEPGVSEPG